MLTKSSIGWGSGVWRRPLRTSYSSHRESWYQDQRRARGANIQDASKALQVRSRIQRVERAWNWWCKTAETPREWQDETRYEKRQDSQGLREPLWYDETNKGIFTFIVADRGTVVPDMKLSPNVGSDRSWVWNAAADVSEGEPEAQTLAIRFANSESKTTESSICGVNANHNLRCWTFQGSLYQGSTGQWKILQKLHSRSFLLIPIPVLSLQFLNCSRHYTSQSRTARKIYGLISVHSTSRERHWQNGFFVLLRELWHL